MKMTQKDALSILKLNGTASSDDIKLAYRKACALYHPDRNPAGLEMMKLVNAAYAALDGYIADSVKSSEASEDYGDEINTALNAIINLGLNIEICGAWLWVSGDTKPHKEALKAAGFKWAAKKAMWNFRPAEWKSFNRGAWSMDKIRATHGSTTIRGKSYQQLEA